MSESQSGRPARLQSRSELLSLALNHHRVGRAAEAERFYGMLLKDEPDDAAVLHLMGIALYQLGRPDEAARFLRRAIAIQPGEAAWHANLGEVLRACDDTAGAEAAFTAAIAVDPGVAEGWNGLGLMAVARRDWDRAAACFVEAVRLKPALAQAAVNAGNALIAAGRPDDAMRALQPILDQAPGHADAWAAMGDAQFAVGDLAGAEAAYAHACAADPGQRRARGRLGEVLRAEGRLEEAAACFAELLAGDPDSIVARNNLAMVRVEQGRAAEGIAHLRAAPALAAGLEILHGNLCFSLCYDETATPEAVLAEHRAWNRRHACALDAEWRPWTCAPDPDRLRVGYVSGDLRAHPVGSFLEPVLAHRDRARFETVCYDTRGGGDAVTARLKDLADAWVPAAALAPAALAERVRADGIHILIDCGGHTAPATMLTFARRPAPLQLLGFGYCFSTGLDAIDAVLLDRHHAPPGAEALFAERVVRLPAAYVCWQPPTIAPDPGPPPALATGTVTFGSLNNLSKVGDGVLGLWARVLAAVPGSRLIVKAGALSDPATRAHTLARMAQAGLPAGRVEVLGLTDQAANLATYGRIDIGLDTWPYSGGVTTLEALWMGIPVVTLAGRAWFGRHSACHLTVAGVPELVAADADGYVAIAAGLAGDRDALARLRAGLRQKVAASPLCDGAGYAAALEESLAGLWREVGRPRLP